MAFTMAFHALDTGNQPSAVTVLTWYRYFFVHGRTTSLVVEGIGSTVIRYRQRRRCGPKRTFGTRLSAGQLPAVTLAPRVVHGTGVRKPPLSKNIRLALHWAGAGYCFCGGRDAARRCALNIAARDKHQRIGLPYGFL